VKATKDHGGQYIYANPLFLKECSAKVFMPFLEKEFPHLVEKYRQRYANNAFVSAAYRRRISELMRKLRQKHGLGLRPGYEGQSDNRAEEPKPIPRDEQMNLF
jgi:hypothetical protein